MYAFVLEADGFEFLIDPAELWKPPRVLVRSGWRQAEVWLDEENLSFRRPGRFGQREEGKILALVRENLGDFLAAWFRLREDVRRDRLDRTLLIE